MGKKKWSPKVGDKVTVKEAVEARYSRYAGNPECIIEPGVVGTVGAVDVPYVTRNNGTFVCVDFVVEGTFQGNPIHGNCTWRIGTPANNLVPVV